MSRTDGTTCHIGTGSKDLTYDNVFGTMFLDLKQSRLAESESENSSLATSHVHSWILQVPRKPFPTTGFFSSAPTTIDSTKLSGHADYLDVPWYKAWNKQQPNAYFKVRTGWLCNFSLCSAVYAISFSSKGRNIIHAEAFRFVESSGATRVRVVWYRACCRCCEH